MGSRDKGTQYKSGIKQKERIKGFKTSVKQFLNDIFIQIINKKIMNSNYSAPYFSQMNQQEFRNQIEKHLHLRDKSYEMFLSDHKGSELLFELMIGMVEKQVNEQNKMLVCIGINFLVQQNFKERPHLPQFWAMFQNGIMKNERLTWKCHRILTKSIEMFLQSFQLDLAMILSQSFGAYCFSVKVLILNCIVRQKFMDMSVEIDQKERVKFLQSSIDEYIRNGLYYIKDIFRKQDFCKPQILSELSERCMQFFESLQETMKYLNFTAEESNMEQKLYNRLCKNEQLLGIIHEALVLGSEDNMKYCWFLKSGDIKVLQVLNFLKSIAVKVLRYMVNGYQKYASIAEFDKFAVLGLMQNNVPLIINELSQSKLKEMSLQSNKFMCMSLLYFLQKSLQFMFMNNYFNENREVIFWKILYPFLQISDEELRLYENEPEQFIGESQNVIQEIEENSEMFATIKNYAAILLQRFVEYIDSSLSSIVNASCDIINHIVSQPCPSVEELSKVYEFEATVETSLTILSILSIKINKRDDLLNKIALIFVEEKILSVRCIGCARLLLYLSYNYERVFQNRLNGYKYLQLASHCLGQNESLVKCALQLFQSCIQVQYGREIWEKLVSLIMDTQYGDIIRLIRKIVEQNMTKIMEGQIVLLIKNLIARVKLQYQNKHENHPHIQNTFVNECLIILNKISKNSQYLISNQLISANIWEIFSFFFQRFEHIEYEDSIIKIFTNVLRSVESLNQDFYQFLPFFKAYHNKVQKVGILFQTYVLLIERGQLYLMDAGKQYLIMILDHLQYVLMFPKGDGTSVREVCLLYQYILTIFPDKFDHERLYDITKYMYDQNTENFNDKTIASILNYWLLGSVVNNVYDIGKIRQKKVDTFKGYSARVLSYGIHLKMVMCARNKNLQQVQCLFLMGLYLLQNLSSDHQQFIKYSKQEKHIRKFKEIDPFKQIREGFDEIKCELNSQELQIVMNNIFREIPIEGVQSLLNRFQVNHEVRKIYSIRKPI